MPSRPVAFGDATMPIPVVAPSHRIVPAVDDVGASDGRRPGASLRDQVELLVPVSIGALAFGLRLMVMLRGGGLAGIGAYDDGVYYTAADALLHGRLPYRDFLFIQPPGVVIATVPFAAIGSSAGDAVGFALGRVAFEVVGGVNAVLAYFAARRFGLTAAVIAGVLVAVLLPAVYAERSILLEPLGTVGILTCLVLLARRPTSGTVVLAGVAAGCAIDVKIWYVVPVAVILLIGTKHCMQLAGGVVAAVAVGYGPFVVAAPVAAFREIVLDQLGRPATPDLMTRITAILGARAAGPLDLQQVTLLLLVLAATAVGVCMTMPGALLFPVMLLADAAVLVLAPSWFEHYADLTAPPLALCCGLAVQRLLRRAGPCPVRAGLAALVVVAVLTAGTATDDVRSGTAVPAAFATAVRSVGGCITTDDPTLLVVTDSLSRDLADRRCVVWPDVSGWTYDAYSDHTADGRPVPRSENARWQHAVLAYLESGRATVLVRPIATGLTVASRRAVYHGDLLIRAGHIALHLTYTTGTEHHHARHHRLHPHVR